MKYTVIFGWDLGCDQFMPDVEQSFDSKELADDYMWSVWRSDPKKYDLCRTFVEDKEIAK
jgi:hypothetical protein